MKGGRTKIAGVFSCKEFQATTIEFQLVFFVQVIPHRDIVHWYGIDLGGLVGFLKIL